MGFSVDWIEVEQTRCGSTFNSLGLCETIQFAVNQSTIQSAGYLF